MGRGKEEQAICGIMRGLGFSEPSMRVQGVLFSGCTPAGGSGGLGRGAVVMDIGKVGFIGGVRVESVCSLKAGKSKKNTVIVSTGRREHIDSVISAGMLGYSLPMVVVALPECVVEGKGEDAVFSSYGEVYVCSVNVGELIRDCGGVIPMRTVGQGKGKGMAYPLAWGEKLQRSAAGKEYRYISLQVNLKKVGVSWEGVGMGDLGEWISGKCEGVII